MDLLWSLFATNIVISCSYLRLTLGEHTCLVWIWCFRGKLIGFLFFLKEAFTKYILTYNIGRLPHKLAGAVWELWPQDGAVTKEIQCSPQQTNVYELCFRYMNYTIIARLVRLLELFDNGDVRIMKNLI